MRPLLGSTDNLLLLDPWNSEELPRVVFKDLQVLVHDILVQEFIVLLLGAVKLATFKRSVCSSIDESGCLSLALLTN